MVSVSKFSVRQSGEWKASVAGDHEGAVVSIRADHRPVALHKIAAAIYGDQNRGRRAAGREKNVH